MEHDVETEGKCDDNKSIPQKKLKKGGYNTVEHKAIVLRLG